MNTKPEAMTAEEVLAMLDRDIASGHFPLHQRSKARAAVSAMVGEIEKLRADHALLSDDYKSLQADLTAARSRVEELELDAKRLDWLSSNPRTTEIRIGGKVELGYAYVVTGNSMWTLRQILDALEKPT